MIIGGSKKEVIENIKKNTISLELNKKVEVGDPILDDYEINKLLDNFYKNRKSPLYNFKKKYANKIVKKMQSEVGKIDIDGLDNLKNLDLSKGAIITCNHFNPLDSYAIRKVAHELNKKLYIVIEDTNLKLPGIIGFLMNNLDVLPVSKSPNYLIKKFSVELKKVLDQGNLVLIYPEEEMWFNYSKPRPCKRGAYQFATTNNVPVISCFVELVDLGVKDNDEFNKVKYIVHILKPIIFDKNKTIKQNSIDMANIDYEQKKEAYEKAYGKRLTYDFTYEDIVGLKN